MVKTFQAYSLHDIRISKFDRHNLSDMRGQFFAYMCGHIVVGNSVLETEAHVFYAGYWDISLVSFGFLAHVSC